MMKILMVFCLAIYMLLLSGCSMFTTPPLIVTNTVVVMPPDQMFVCPATPAPPTGDAYTQVDVARYILQLHSVAGVCSGSLLAVQQYLNEASKLEQGKP